MRLLPFLLALPLARASPLPEFEPELPAFFYDSPIPFSDSPELPFNLTAETTELKGSVTRENHLEKRLVKLQYIQCLGTVDGRNLGNPVPFRWTGKITVTQPLTTSGTKNGKNALDVIVNINGLSTSAGSFQYVTNRYMYPYIGGPTSSKLDYAYVTSKGSTVTVVVDKNLATSNPRSVFMSRSGLFQPSYFPVAGGFTLNIAKGKCTGWFNMVGRAQTSTAQAPYKATFQGTASGGSAYF